MAKPPHPKPGPYTPTLILHGGAGSITRSHLPPPLYAQYAASLSKYATSTHTLLHSGHSALNAACHAVSLMEDDPLFNCGKGSVFTSDGEIEMEASVMVCSVESGWEGEGSVKRGAAASLVTETRHPILLARELLRQGDEEWTEVGSMHCQRSGKGVEEWGWGKGLERKGKDWFWTRKRWEEHLRGLKKENEGAGMRGSVSEEDADAVNGNGNEDEDGHSYDGMNLPSQGTVGAVCMDSWGTLAVATSTGGLTNKKPGRIGDTPTLGAGFWAESWDEEIPTRSPATQQPPTGLLDLAAEDLSSVFSASLCLPSFSRPSQSQPTLSSTQTFPAVAATEKSSQPYTSPPRPSPSKPPASRRRAVAMSGTGNGDSFLRTNAARTAAAMARFSPTALSQAATNVAGYDGELQRSAGERWGQTGEGEGGIIGIEAVGGSEKGHLVADFNCGGMWRAWIDEKSGEARVLVFKEEYM